MRSSSPMARRSLTVDVLHSNLSMLSFSSEQVLKTSCKTILSENLSIEVWHPEDPQEVKLTFNGMFRRGWWVKCPGDAIWMIYDICSYYIYIYGWYMGWYIYIYMFIYCWMMGFFLQPSPLAQNQWSPIYDISAILTSIQVGSEPRLVNQPLKYPGPFQVPNLEVCTRKTRTMYITGFARIFPKICLHSN